MSNQVKVTQADRDAAEQFRRGIGGSYDRDVYDLAYTFAQHRLSAITAQDAEIARLREALEPFCFFGEEGGAEDTTQQAWEIRHRDHFNDWIDFNDIDRARQALAQPKEPPMTKSHEELAGKRLDDYCAKERCEDSPNDQDFSADQMPRLMAGREANTPKQLDDDVAGLIGELDQLHKTFLGWEAAPLMWPHGEWPFSTSDLRAVIKTMANTAAMLTKLSADAKQVRLDERERCANIAFDYSVAHDGSTAVHAMKIGKAIRAGDEA